MSKPGNLTSDTDPNSVTVLRKSGRAIKTLQTGADQSEAQRKGMTIETTRKPQAAGGVNKQHTAAKNTARLDNETEELHHEHTSLALGRVIQQGRQAKGWTQKELAMQISEKPHVVAEYENGKAVPNQEILSKLERALGLRLRGKEMGEPLPVPVMAAKKRGRGKGLGQIIGKAKDHGLTRAQRTAAAAAEQEVSCNSAPNLPPIEYEQGVTKMLRAGGQKAITGTGAKGMGGAAGSSVQQPSPEQWDPLQPGSRMLGAGGKIGGDAEQTAASVETQAAFVKAFVSKETVRATAADASSDADVERELRMELAFARGRYAALALSSRDQLETLTVDNEYLQQQLTTEKGKYAALEKSAREQLQAKTQENEELQHQLTMTSQGLQYQYQNYLSKDAALTATLHLLSAERARSASLMHDLEDSIDEKQQQQHKIAMMSHDMQQLRDSLENDRQQPQVLQAATTAAESSAVICPMCTFQSSTDLIEHAIAVHLSDAGVQLLACASVGCAFQCRLAGEMRAHFNQHPLHALAGTKTPKMTAAARDAVRAVAMQLIFVDIPTDELTGAGLLRPL